DGDGAEDPAPRRAGRRHEPDGDARDHGADRTAAGRGRLHDPPDRARHACGRGHLGSGGRARSRRQDRRGFLRCGRHRPARGGGVPRDEGGNDEVSEASGNENGAAPEPLLRLDSVDTFYGQIHILQGLTLDVLPGELVCLLGGNASGKSTTLKTVLGIVKPRNGTVSFGGEDITSRSTSYRIGKGIAIVPENRRLFGPMTVLENLEMG